MALGVWVVAMVYSVAYCYTHGYGRSVDTLTFVLWFPDWVFWGIIVPWLTCTLVSVVFAFGIMGDEPLGEEIDSDSSAAPSSEAGHAR
jgi:hypothetical protein